MAQEKAKDTEQVAPQTVRVQFIPKYTLVNQRLIDPESGLTWNYRRQEKGSDVLDVPAEVWNQHKERLIAGHKTRGQFKEVA